jgi:biopolymer transport protein ExbB
MERGGWVMWPLLMLSVISLGLIFERGWFWARMRRATRGGRLTQLLTRLRKGDFDQAELLVAGDRSVYGRVIQGLINLGADETVGIEVVEGQRHRLERFMVLLSTIITAAPLLGILGTVSGIIQSFRLLGSSDVVTDPRAVSAGIAEALLTTAFGLIVALVTLFPYMAFRARLDQSLGRLEAIIAAACAGARHAGRASGESETGTES